MGAKTVLTNFSQKIEGQPTEDDIMNLVKELDIERLKAVAEDVKGSATVKDTDKAKMEAIQEIVAPLQQATDAGSLVQIFQTDCIPKIQNLEEVHFEYFMSTVEKLVDRVPKLAKHFKCEAARWKCKTFYSG